MLQRTDPLESDHKDAGSDDDDWQDASFKSALPRKPGKEKTPCRYWDKCYRKKRSHFLKYLHPEELSELDSSDNDAPREATELQAAIAKYQDWVNFAKNSFGGAVGNVSMARELPEELVLQLRGLDFSDNDDCSWEHGSRSGDSSQSVEAFERKELEKDSPEYLSVEEKVLKSIQPSHNWHPNILRIEKVRNECLRRKFENQKKRLFDPYVDLKFHGTKASNIESICTIGFRVPPNDGKRRMFGRGIYFSTDSSKSAQHIYTNGSNVLLLCEVLIGKTYTVERAQENMTKELLQQMQFDSLYAKRNTAGQGGVKFDEFVVYDGRRAFPTYVIYYTTAGAVNGVSPANVIPTATTRSPPNDIGPDAIKKYELVASRTFDPGSKEEHHYRIAESQFLRLQSQGHGYQQYKLKQVTWVDNPTLHRRFLSKQNEFKAKYQNTDEYMQILAFHGTPKPENIEMIIRYNFDNSKIRRTSRGHGHYFSEFPDVSVEYSSGTKMLLLCQLLPGRTNDNGGNIPAGYDSNRVGSDGSGRGQMIIIANVDQILPCYILHFE